MNKDEETNNAIPEQPHSWMKSSGIVYLIGISIFGLFYYEIKEFIGGGVLFVVAAIIYFICLRVIADLVTGKHKKCRSK